MARRARERAETVKIAVRDTGPGIATEDMPRLFKEFSQLDTTSTREYEGTGLGLALARSLAEQLGGRVGVESVLGEGSEFWVEFTRTDAGESQPDLESTPKEWLIDPIALANQPSETTSSPQGPADGGSCWSSTTSRIFARWCASSCTRMGSEHSRRPTDNGHWSWLEPIDPT